MDAEEIDNINSDSEEEIECVEYYNKAKLNDLCCKLYDGLFQADFVPQHLFLFLKSMQNFFDKM